MGREAGQLVAHRPHPGGEGSRPNRSQGCPFVAEPMPGWSRAGRAPRTPLPVMAHPDSATSKWSQATPR
jgi:hypothetical protein